MVTEHQSAAVSLRADCDHEKVSLLIDPLPREGSDTMCSEISFVYVFVKGVCACVCSPFVGQRDISVLFCSMPEVFETGFLAELGAHHSRGISPALGAQLPTTMASFSHVFWRLNSDPHACTPMRDFVTQLPSARLRDIMSLTDWPRGQQS